MAGIKFEYPIRILAARAAVAAAAAAADGDAWKLCCWTIAATGGDWRSSVQEWNYTREGTTQEGNVHPHWNMHSTHNTGRARAHKNAHTHFITACLYHQSVIICARTHKRTHMRVTTARLHHQSTMGPAAHYSYHCQHWLQPQHHHGAHATTTTKL
eukprot:1158610-Pelagomonas_calceolata.AAC.10